MEALSLPLHGLNTPSCSDFDARCAGGDSGPKACSPPASWSTEMLAAARAKGMAGDRCAGACMVTMDVRRLRCVGPLLRMVWRLFIERLETGSDARPRGPASLCKRQGQEGGGRTLMQGGDNQGLVWAGMNRPLPPP